MNKLLREGKVDISLDVEYVREESSDDSKGSARQTKYCGARFVRIQLWKSDDGVE